MVYKYTFSQKQIPVIYLVYTRITKAKSIYQVYPSHDQVFTMSKLSGVSRWPWLTRQDRLWSPIRRIPPILSSSLCAHRTLARRLQCPPAAAASCDSDTQARLRLSHWRRQAAAGPPPPGGRAASFNSGKNGDSDGALGESASGLSPGRATRKLCINDSWGGPLPAAPARRPCHVFKTSIFEFLASIK